MIETFDLQYDSFQIESEANHIVNENWYVITKKPGFIADLKQITL